MAKKIQKRGQCIFCGGGPLSKEHIWADWLREFLPHLDTSSRHGVTHRDGRYGYGKLHRPGDVRSQRLRVVCETCNNGWMSRIQNDAKPIIANLLQHGMIATDPESLRTLASWAVMFTFVFECAEPVLANSTAGQRRQFMADKAPPIGWDVYISKAAISSDRLAAWRRAGDDLHHQDPSLNAQATAINLESWVLLTTFASNGDNFHASRYGMVSVWPLLGSIMDLNSAYSFENIQIMMFELIPDPTGTASDATAAFSNRLW
jgi:hypothetical protein